MADALTYQLNLPKEWIREGQIRAIAFDINCAFPMLVNTGYGFGLLFGCPAFANGLALWISILCAAAVYGWSLEKAAPRYAWLAAAVFLLTPAVYNHVIAPYVDLTLALCCACAFWAFDRWARTESCPWLGLSGIFCGLALGAKYLALIYFLILAAAIVVCALRQKQGWSGTFRAILLFGFFAAVTSFVWYVRSSWIMGNPLYPYLFKLIGGRPSPVEWQLAERAYGVGYNLWNLAAIFWDATFQPQAYAGFGTRWNLIFLGLLPLVVWLVVRRQGGWLAFLSGAMLVSWFYLSQVMRFLMAFFPLYCVLIGWAA
ncbi:MAG: hypothetical protein HY767_01090, partial [Candidatus Omnitrophica bacterium]|nr:hypothetical protein [Candidatus Omnitrophota bacterium]